MIEGDNTQGLNQHFCDLPFNWFFFIFLAKILKNSPPTSIKKIINTQFFVLITIWWFRTSLYIIVTIFQNFRQSDKRLTKYPMRKIENVRKIETEKNAKTSKSSKIGKILGCFCCPEKCYWEKIAFMERIYQLAMVLYVFIWFNWD